jgi:signal transduction histidine kinase
MFFGVSENELDSGGEIDAFAGPRGCPRKVSASQADGHFIADLHDGVLSEGTQNRKLQNPDELPGVSRSQEPDTPLKQDIAQSLQRVLDFSVKLLSADKGSLQLYDERDHVLKVVAYAGFNTESLKLLTSLPARFSVGSAVEAEQEQGIVAEDTFGCLKFKELALLYVSNGIVAVRSTPLLSSNKTIIGVLSTYFCRPYQPAERELRLLRFCAEHAARLIEYERLQNEMYAAVERLTEQNTDLQDWNARLTRSNQDLDRFAFAASHDLQAPLRLVTTYAQLLARRYGGGLDEDSTMLVDTIVQGTTRMSELLADLLAYAEIGAFRDESVESVDLNLVVEKVTQNLRVFVDESGASIVSGDLPMLSGHECHFVQLFQNLIANAIKYRGRLTPRVHISAHETDEGLEFAVADNGLGIGPENHERIFQAFKRLHDTRTPGTGIGLAICQRVVERYGGRIWVESEAGHGATFRFTLPKIAVPSAREK